MSSTQLEFNVNGENLTAPLAFEDIRLIDLSADYAASDSAGSDVRLTKGFFFKSETAGLFNAITLYQWKRGLAAYTGTISDPITDVQRNSVLQFIRDNGDKVNLYIAAYQWVDTPVVFLESDNAASVIVNIGIY